MPRKGGESRSRHPGFFKHPEIMLKGRHVVYLAIIFHNHERDHSPGSMRIGNGLHSTRDRPEHFCGHPGTWAFSAHLQQIWV